MKRLFALTVVAVGLSIGPAAAQESPESQLDFVRKLRAKGYHDLTKEYIDLLVKAQPQLAGPLALEEARSLVAMARERNLEQRAGLFNQARDRFQDFVAKNAGKPEAAQARLELAKLVAYHGQTILSKILRDMDDPKEQHEAARKAEELFVQAGKELDLVIKELQGKEQVQATFDRAVNYMDQARTYLDLDKQAINRQRGELMLSAKKMFLTLATDESSEVGLLANAWLVKVNFDGQDPKVAVSHLKKVLGSTEKSAAPAQRLARYFALQHIPKDVDLKLKPLDKIKLIETEANKWLKDYPAAHKSWEGQGVRFELANAYLTEAQLLKDLKSPAAAALLNLAQKYYSALADLDGDFSEEAKRRNVFIAVTKLEKIKLEDIRTFEDSLLKAHYEVYKLKEAGRLLEDAKSEDERKKLAPAKKDHYREAVRALWQTLNLIDGSTPLAKVDEARSLQMQLYWSEGDMARAAIAGEALGKVNRPPTKNAPRGIGVAFLAYDTISMRDDSEANRQKVRDLADFVLSPESQKFWANEPVTAVAHHRLAMLHHKDKDFQRAIEHLEKLPIDFAGFTYAQGQLAFIALGAAADKSNNLTDSQRQQLRDKARKAIQRMPASLPLDADSSTATMYYHAQMELPKVFYKEASDALSSGKLADAATKYRGMGKFVDQHYEGFKKSTIKFEDKTKGDLDAMLASMQKYSRLGLADVEYRLGNYDAVLKLDLVVTLLKQMKERGKKEGKIRAKDHVVSGEILGLVLRTYVQKGDLDSAQEVFDLLDRLTPEDDGGLQGESGNMIFALVNDIEQHVKTLKKAKDESQLKIAVDKYSKFVEAIAESILKKRAEPQDYKFLANAYATLGRPDKAAELFAKVPTPKQVKDVDEELDRRAQAKKPGFTDDDSAKLRTKLAEDEYRKNAESAKLEEQVKKLEAANNQEAAAEARTQLAQHKAKVAGDVAKERQDYWYLQIQYGKALREGKDFKKAYATLSRLINHPLGEYHLIAEMEKLFVLEDSNTLGAAVTGWGDLTKRLRDRVGEDTALKKLFFECYFYNARSWYKYSQSSKVQDAKKEDQFLLPAARYILSLETTKNKEGWEAVGERFIELMDAEPKLKAAYEKMKKGQTAQAPAGK